MESFIEFIASLGYMGLFISALLMFMIFPLPAQPMMITAGILISRGEMNFAIALFSASTGAVIGALINYIVAIKFGRDFLLNKLKWFIEIKHLDRMEWIFAKFGTKALFIGLILPSIGQMLTLPAGLAKMNFKKFITVTIVGSVIWCTYLIYLGILFGDHIDIIQERLALIGSIIALVVIFGVISFFILKKQALKYYRLMRWKENNGN